MCLTSACHFDLYPALLFIARPFSCRIAPPFTKISVDDLLTIGLNFVWGDPKVKKPELERGK
jgi:hypothetical protein